MNAPELSPEQRVEELARLCGIGIVPDEVTEVAYRFSSLVQELDKLLEVDLSDVQPVVIFPEPSDPGH